MNNPKIEVEITPTGIKVALHNWIGVSNMMVEHVHYAIIKESQILRAKSLGAIHAANIEAEAAAKKIEDTKKS